MSRLTRCVVIVAAGLLSACSTTTYWSDWDEGADFDRYSSFAWFERAKAKGPVPEQGMTRFVTKRIERSVVAELEGKGYSSGEVASADFLVTYFVGIRHRFAVHHTSFGYPYHWYWGGWGGWAGGTSRLVNYPEGTLIVDVIDKRNRQMVWRGVAEGAFTSPDPDQAQVAKVVAKLMAGFPPA